MAQSPATATPGNCRCSHAAASLTRTRPSQPLRLEPWELPVIPFAVVVDNARIKQGFPFLHTALAGVSRAVPDIGIPTGDWESAVARVRLDDPAVPIERGEVDTFWCVGPRHAHRVAALLRSG